MLVLATLQASGARKVAVLLLKQPFASKRTVLATLLADLLAQFKNTFPHFYQAHSHVKSLPTE